MQRVAGLVILLLAGCQAPVSSWKENERVRPSVEALAGARAAPALEARFGGVVSDARAERRMARVASCLHGREGDQGQGAGTGQYQLLASEALNALSLPGGRIYITRGLYARLSSDDCLAAVLAHERAHLEAKDHFKPPCANAGAALAREIVADRCAAQCLEASGFRRSAMVEVIRIIRPALPHGWPERRAAALAEGVLERNPLRIQETKRNDPADSRTGHRGQRGRRVPASTKADQGVSIRKTDS